MNGADLNFYMPSPLFQQLPGLDLPVSEISSTLAHMWQSGEGAPSEFRASQLNLVVHLGVTTPVVEGLAIFNTAIAFAQCYPCRLIFLCPTDKLQGKDSIDAKLYSICYIGDVQQPSMAVCEAIILSYLPQDGHYLEDIVTLWLENDLPVYRWFHRFSQEALKNGQLPWLHGCRRALYDSAVEDPAVQSLHWPHPQLVSDITRAQLLPARQSIGQLLAVYPPAQLISGLQRVEVSYALGHQAQAESLLQWQRQTLSACGGSTTGGTAIAFSCKPIEPQEEATLSIHWQYANSQVFTWAYSEERHSAHTLLKIGTVSNDLVQPLELLCLEGALAEALFS